jgi:RNA polymerase sigma-70 factor (ECF subfamily)
MRNSGTRLDFLIQAWSKGERSALEELAPLIYGELRAIAARYRRAENRESTLQTTELVHEAFLRISASDRTWCANRAQFFTLAARVIRNILVDAARRRGRHKRGDGAETVPLENDLFVSAPVNVDLEILDLALNKLKDLDPAKAEIVELRFFGGLSVDEVAGVLCIGTATVKRHWAVARAWLYREIKGNLPE